MPTLSDIAIVLRQWDFSETSQTVRVLTREHGAIRGLAKGARRERGMFSGGFEVCTRGQLVAIVKPGRDLATLTEWRLLEVFPGIRQRLAANRVALLAADLVAHMLDDGDPHPEVFDGLVDLLRRLAEPGEEGRGLLSFQWLLLHVTGYTPRLDRDAVTGVPLDEDAAVLAFRPDAGGFTTAEAATGAPGSWRLRRTTLDVLRAVEAAGAMAEGPASDSADPHDQSDPHDPGDPGDPHDPHGHPGSRGAPDAAAAAPADARDPGPSHEAITRANRLLATYIRHLVGRELPTIEWAFGSD